MGSLRSGAAELCAESEAPCIEADVWSLHLGPGARVLEQAAADAVYTVPCCQKGEVRMWKGVSHSGKRGAAQTGPPSTGTSGRTIGERRVRHRAKATAKGATHTSVWWLQAGGLMWPDVDLPA
jgi:hypothetical protein